MNILHTYIIANRDTKKTIFVNALNLLDKIRIAKMRKDKSYLKKEVERLYKIASLNFNDTIDNCEKYDKKIAINSAKLYHVLSLVSKAL